MSSTVDLAARPAWSIRPITIGQIPLVVSWIAAINTNYGIDEIDLSNRMQREIREAREQGLSEYYIGYFEQFAIFFLVGSPSTLSGYTAGQRRDSQQAYEIATLLANPLIAEDLYFSLFYQAIRFVFENPRVGQVVYHCETDSELHRTIMRRLGFQVDDGSCRAGGQGRYRCRRDQFLSG